MLKMSQRVLFNIALFLLLLSTLTNIAAAKPIDLADDEADRLNGHLSYYMKLFANMAATTEEYVLDLQRQLQLFADVRAGDNLAAKEALLADYDGDLAANFRAYLQQEIEMQWLTEELLLERWYLQRLRTAFAGEPIARQLDALLSQYEQTMSIADFDDKYERFTTIRDGYSPELVAIMDADPETVPMLDAHLQLLGEYLQYLIDEHRGGGFEADIGQLLREVEGCVNGDDTAWKLQSLNKFDDESTKFGRFLSHHINEFFLYKFSTIDS